MNFLYSKWRQQTIAVQFFSLGLIVILLFMLATGSWVSQRIREGVIRNTAASTALYMDSIIAPLVQDLAHGQVLQPEAISRLESLLKETSLGKGVSSFKIWKEGGYIAYSNRRSIIGHSFPITDDLEEAFEGEVTADFDDLHDDEDAAERQTGIPLLEMYSPIREAGTGRIIAVAEFYENGEELKKTLEISAMESWLIIGVASVAMFLMLFGVVYRASLTIREQEANLKTKLSQNEMLREKLQAASRRVTEINEQSLRRLGAELHDGPAQILAYAALRLDTLAGKIEDAAIIKIRSSLNEALSDIRHICRGLSLPELDRLTPKETLASVIHSHISRTDTQLRADLSQVPAFMPKSHKIAIFRFVQEALNNAYKHAGSKDVKIETGCVAGNFTVTVSDQGPGFDMTSKKSLGVDAGMGLTGLHDRFESLCGSIYIDSNFGAGTRLTASLPLEESEHE